MSDRYNQFTMLSIEKKANLSTSCMKFIKGLQL